MKLICGIMNLSAVTSSLIQDEKQLFSFAWNDFVIYIFYEYLKTGFTLEISVKLKYVP